MPIFSPSPWPSPLKDEGRPEAEPCSPVKFVPNTIVYQATSTADRAHTRTPTCEMAGSLRDIGHF